MTFRYTGELMCGMDMVLGGEVYGGGASVLHLLGAGAARGGVFASNEDQILGRQKAIQSAARSS